ncbi:MAG: substrate-binding and VWA domain-containing protein [Actinomycetota bacterium]|nr:substrate-binding and VWA domain-containing protein [Actinomycetota bacterium]
MRPGPTTLARLATGVSAMVAVVILALLPPSRFCVPVTIAASNEKSALLSVLADDYERGRPVVDGRCVDVQIFRVPSGEAEAALRRGWDAVSVGAPEPGVWSPAATTWVKLLDFHRTADGLPKVVPAATPSITQSPLVIAMLKPLAEAMGWPGKDIGWADIFDLAQDPQGWANRGHADWGRFKLGKTSPLISTSGLHALIATHYAGGGKGDGSAPEARTLALMRAVENSVLHYGDTVSTYLKDLLACDDRGLAEQCVSAIAIEEKQVWDYNRGNPSSLVPEPKGVVPRVPLVAIYPREGTLFADHPYVVLTSDDQKRRAADGFLVYLQGPEAQGRFQRAGLRGYNGDPGPEITKINFLDPGKPTSVYPLPVPAVVSDIQASWKAIRKPARVLLVVDVGSSMAERAPDTSKTKLDVAKEAASEALGGFEPGDEVGLWSFSSASGADPPYREVVPPGLISQQKALLKHDIEALQPQGQHKALYRTLDAAVASMRASYDSARINAVVLLTDGGNDDPANNDLNGLQRTLRAQPDDKFVRVFTVGFGAKADLTTLENIALAARGGAYSAKDKRAMDKILVSVVSNF